MITQKMISVKLDIDELIMLDNLCVNLHVNRNKLINFAVKMLNSNLFSYNECLLTYVYSKCFIEDFK